MSLEFVTGDIFASGAEALVNPVNCKGVMGKGLALTMKQRFPDNYKFYEAACRNGVLQIGKMYVVELRGHHPTRFIVNFPTKVHWRDSSNLAWIRHGLVDLCQQIGFLQITHIALPALGCGNGHLLWSDVKPLIESILDNPAHVSSLTRIQVYEPLD